MSAAPTTDGVVVVDKPASWTSHDVVARVRREAGTRKVGHAGTLDPMATGVLVLGVGRATRLLGHLGATTKEYDATIRLGMSTSTDDAEGEPLSRVDTGALSDADVAAAVADLVGDLHQVPSAVSAIKVGGKRAYARVRAGESVSLPARPVRVDAFDIHSVRRLPGQIDVDVAITCSSGTYVRALARDLGSALAVGGHLTVLRRTRVGAFRLADSVTLDELSRQWCPLSLAEVAHRCFPVHQVSDEQADMVRHGRALPRVQLPSGAVALLDGADNFLALYEQHGPVARAIAVFAEQECR